MLLFFTKMHGQGNDFMIVDGLTKNIKVTVEKIRQWSNRCLGVGFDQLLIVEAPTCPDADFYYRIYNADGSEAEQCGNGARCFVKFVYEKKIACSKKMMIQVVDRILEMILCDDGEVQVEMGEPIHNGENYGRYSVDIIGHSIDIHAISMGNPHAVIHYANLAEQKSLHTSNIITELAPFIQQHHLFPYSCNVGFFEVISRSKINLRVIERGAGETLSCGTGACAAMASAFLLDMIDTDVNVCLPGGDLQISWQGPGTSIYMKGPAVKVYEGHIRI